MKFFVAFAVVALSCPALANDARVYMIGKVKILDTTLTKVVLFYDKGITNMQDCHREIQRGVRGQWRYHHHKFENPRRYSQHIDYYCVQSQITASAWYSKANYDFVYKIDIRDPTMMITAQKSYADCLHSVRREAGEETSKFFCAKLSQNVQL